MGRRLSGSLSISLLAAIGCFATSAVASTDDHREHVAYQMGAASRPVTLRWQVLMQEPGGRFLVREISDNGDVAKLASVEATGSGAYEHVLQLDASYVNDVNLELVYAAPSGRTFRLSTATIHLERIDSLPATSTFHAHANVGDVRETPLWAMASRIAPVCPPELVELGREHTPETPPPERILG